VLLGVAKNPMRDALLVRCTQLVGQRDSPAFISASASFHSKSYPTVRKKAYFVRKTTLVRSLNADFLS
jgi:hypothetical protein